MDFIDEQNRIRHVFQFAHDSLQALFKVPPVTGARKQCAHIQRIDDGFLKHFRHVTIHDTTCQPFGNGRLADARITDIKRVVL